MNNQRRKELYTVIDKIIEIQRVLVPIRNYEEECRDNIPDNLQRSVRYKKADNAVWALDDACYAFEEIIEFIGYAIE